jgi:hypothetical protein
MVSLRQKMSNKLSILENLQNDYVYSGFQGEEEDVRAVAECSEFSIKKLRILAGK